jgi:agmatinase
MIHQSSSTYDPSGVGQANGNLFGLPHDRDAAATIAIGVPWEVTVSYHPGTAKGPERVLEASPQLDLYDWDCPDGWQKGIYLEPIDPQIQARSDRYRQLAAQIIDRLEHNQALTDAPDLTPILMDINQAGEELNHWLEQKTAAALDLGRKVAVIGGDHSVPLGYLRSLAKRYPEFGILHIDAHADLRNAYEGFKYSHASIMYNVLDLPQVTKLVQVGIRDISPDEIETISAAEGRIITYHDSQLKQQQYAGIPWLETCRSIIANLPPKVYISFDVDGLDPKLCPHTGTPVPGGLELEQTFCLFREIINSDREIIGFDLAEVGNAEWDGNVGARIVYKICNLMHSKIGSTT